MTNQQNGKQNKQYEIAKAAVLHAPLHLQLKMHTFLNTPNVSISQRCFNFFTGLDNS